MPEVFNTSAGPRGFPTTAWGEVTRAQGRDRERAARAVAHLIERYWHPVYFFVRHKGRRREEAKDLTQEFFTSFLEKDVVSYADQGRGRFRSFLLASVSRFLALDRRRASRKPREVNVAAAPFDPDERAGFEPATGETPEDVFMRNWAKCVLENCVRKLEEETRALGKDVQAGLFKARFLEEPHPSGRDLASRFGVSETDVTNYLHRARRRFRRIVREEVADWVALSGEQADDVDDEIRSLLEFMRP